MNNLSRNVFVIKTLSGYPMDISLIFPRVSLILLALRNSLPVLVDHLLADRKSFSVVGHTISIDVVGPLPPVSRLPYYADYLFRVKFRKSLP